MNDEHKTSDWITPALALTAFGVISWAAVAIFEELRLNTPSFIVHRSSFIVYETQA